MIQEAGDRSTASSDDKRKKMPKPTWRIWALPYNAHKHRPMTPQAEWYMNDMIAKLLCLAAVPAMLVKA